MRKVYKVSFRHESASCYIIVTPYTVHLFSFQADEKRKGHGRACFQKACDWADREGRTVRLTASAGKGGMNNKELVEFYKSFGFVEDGSWLGIMPTRMIRVVR